MIVTSEIAIRTDRMIDCMLNTIFFRESGFLSIFHVFSLSPVPLLPDVPRSLSVLALSAFRLLFSGSSVFGRGNTEFLFEYIAEVVRILISHFSAIL